MKNLICAVTGLAVSTVQADIIYVDAANCPGLEAEPYCTIQAAIDVASDTDEIIVTPGSYFETIDFLGKAITLRSDGGPAVTNIDGTVQCVTGEGSDAVLDGFTITGWMDNVASSPTVTNCTFSGSGPGMLNTGSSPTVTNCTFTGNSSVPSKY